MRVSIELGCGVRNTKENGVRIEGERCSEVNFPDVVIDCKEGRRGSFFIHACRWIVLPSIKIRKTGGGNRFGLKIIFKELYPNSEN